jgi:hypothetical protein
VVVQFGMRGAERARRVGFMDRGSFLYTADGQLIVFPRGEEPREPTKAERSQAASALWATTRRGS